MVNQRIKDLYYYTIGKLSMLSFLRHKLFSKRKFAGKTLHIGCGKNYLNGLINIDGNIFRKKDIWLDATLGLPFPAGSMQGIYTSNFLEHFNYADALKISREFYRVLKPGGGLRLVVPSLEYAINMYRENNASAFSSWPADFKSIGGRFNNFLLCGNQHLLMFDFSFLEELLTDAGFKGVMKTFSHKSSFLNDEDMQFEAKNRGEFLYVECVK